MKFIITLSNGTEDKDLVFNIYNTDIAQRWAQEIAMNYPMYETNRFQGWPGSDKDLSYYFKQLQTQIDIVNSYKYDTIISHVTSDQDSLNYLHKFFEELRGEIDLGTEFYNHAPNNVKDAINMFNVLIHETEHLIRSNDTPTIVGTFKDRPRIKLTENDFLQFTFNWKYGEVYINYCEVGKTLLDVFKDNDSYIDKTNIRPQEYYSADFMIKFGVELGDQHYQNRLDQFNRWYNQTDFDFSHLSLGMIPVAIIEQGKPYSGFTQIKSVCIQ
jgi:hypothetical protein